MKITKLHTMILMGLLLFTGLLFAEKVEEVYFRFEIVNRDEIKLFSPIIAIDQVKENVVYAYATRSQFTGLQQKGLKVVELTHPGKKYEVVMADSKEAMRDWDYYPTYTAYVDIMYQFQEDYPDLCTVESIGNSIEGREILVAKISDNVNEEEIEPEFFYSSTMHGDETTGWILMLRLIDYLLTNYESDPEINEMVNNIEIFINPLANPDGTYHDGNNSVFGAIRSNANGVDLNRNFPDFISGLHPDGESWQVENIVVMDYANNHNFVMGGNFHGGTEVLNYPWDTMHTRHADDQWFQLVCRAYADIVHENSPNNYMNEYNDGITNGYDWYEADGTKQDWLNYNPRDRDVTFEISDEKLIPENQLNNHWVYNHDALLNYIKECNYGFTGIITDSDGNPLAAEIKITGHDNYHSEIFSDPELGDYHRPIAPGTYDIQASAFGYNPVVVENVSVDRYELITVNFSLEVSDIVLNGVVTDTDGNAIENASVSLGHPSVNDIYTDANGYFSFENVSPAEYSIVIDKFGYIPYSETISVTDSTYLQIQLRTPYYLEEFENGLNNWNTNGTWGIQTSGNNHFLSDSPNGEYSDDTNSFIKTTAPVSLTGALSAELVLDVCYELESGYDYAYFDASANGTSWQVLDEFNGTFDWHKQSYNLQNYVGGNIYFRFRLLSDGSETRMGILIDNIMIDAVFEVQSTDESAVSSENLFGNYPNPFNPVTSIFFSLQKRSNVELDVYNVKGQKVRSLLCQDMDKGKHTISWQGKDDADRDVSSGIYLFRLKINNNKEIVHNCLLLK